MAYQLKENEGSIWVNDRKKKPADPDRTGKINVFGEEFRLAGWINKTKDGKQYLKLAISRMGDKQADDEIPF